MDVVGLDFVIAASVELRRQQADIADVVLCAGIRAAGQINVERHIEGEPRIDMVGEREPVLPARIEAILRAYLAHRRSGESFHAFAGRHSDPDLVAFVRAGHRRGVK